MSKTFTIKPAPRAPAHEVVKKENAPMRARPREHITSLPSSEFDLTAAFTIRCSNKQHYRLYSIYTKVGMHPIGKQASYPSIFDCLDKLERAVSAGIVSDRQNDAILRSRSVADAINARTSA